MCNCVLGVGHYFLVIRGCHYIGHTRSVWTAGWLNTREIKKSGCGVTVGASFTRVWGLFPPMGQCTIMAQEGDPTKRNLKEITLICTSSRCLSFPSLSLDAIARSFLLLSLSAVWRVDWLMCMNTKGGPFLRNDSRVWVFHCLSLVLPTVSGLCHVKFARTRQHINTFSLHLFSLLYSYGKETKCAWCKCHYRFVVSNYQ